MTAGAGSQKSGCAAPRGCLRTIAPRASGATCARYRPPNMAPTRSSVSKSPDSTTRFRYVADAAVFGQHANRFPSSSLGSPLSFFSQRVSSEFLLTHEPLTCSISPYLITTHSRLTLLESLVGVTSARVPSSRSFESLSHRLHVARHSTASQIKKASVSTLGAHGEINGRKEEPRKPGPPTVVMLAF